MKKKPAFTQRFAGKHSGMPGTMEWHTAGMEGGLFMKNRNQTDTWSDLKNTKTAKLKPTNKMEQLIQMCITAGLVILGITALVAGLLTGAWHLFAIAIASILLAIMVSEKPLKD